MRVRAVGPERFAVGSRRLELDSAVLAQYRGGTWPTCCRPARPLALKNYGPGQLATIALRGTSAQHTAVLWNGLNIMLPTLGQNDFALLPVGATTRVSLQPGPGRRALRQRRRGRGRAAEQRRPTGGPASAAACRPMPAALACGAAAWKPARPRRRWPCA